MIATTMQIVGVLWTVVSWLLAAARVLHASPLVLVYRVDEDCEVGTLLADVKTDAHLSELYSTAVVDRLRLVTLATQSALDSRRHLDVDESSGLVRAATALDRDHICPAARACVLRVDFAVHPAAYFQLIKVNSTSALLLLFYPKFALTIRL